MSTRDIAAEYFAPLEWPRGRARSSRHQPSKFKVKTIGHARSELLRELRLFGARYVVITCNRELTARGIMQSKGSTEPDPGVAIYLDHDGSQLCITCDRWDSIADNLHACALTVEAWRGIRRWGASETLQRILDSFRALPPAPEGEAMERAGQVAVDWRKILGLHSVPLAQLTPGDIKATHRALIRAIHTDRGPDGDPERAALINQARDAALADLQRRSP